MGSVFVILNTSTTLSTGSVKNLAFSPLFAKEGWGDLLSGFQTPRRQTNELEKFQTPSIMQVFFVLY